MIAAQLVVLYVTVGVFHSVASRNAIWEEPGVLSAVWALLVVALWPILFVTRVLQRLKKGDL